MLEQEGFKVFSVCFNWQLSGLYSVNKQPFCQMNFMLERGRVPVPFGPGGKVQPGLLWSPQPWGRRSGNWGLFWVRK